jgi:SNF2 family DNA or RNA helicase
MSDIDIEKRMERFHMLLEKAKFEFKDYQYDGVKWGITKELSSDPLGNCRGGIIADEMGLGKTIMMIGIMYVNFVPNTLIVVPPVLIQQWYNEIYKTSGHKAMMYYGPDKNKITISDLQSAPIVLTSYNSLIKTDCLLKNIIWNRVVFDEAHHLRNSNTQKFRNCNKIKARIKWLVTGTPIQNKVEDFASLCRIAGIRSKFYKNIEDWHTYSKHFMIRRTKEILNINLKKITRINNIVGWKHDKEMKLSEEIHSLLPNQTFVSSTKRRKLADCFGKGGALTALLRARQSCVFPGLMRENIENFYKLGKINNNILATLDYTSKIDNVIELMLERKNNGKGKIIFCHFRKEIDMIYKRLIEGGMKRVIKYDGRNSGGNNLLTISDPADALVIQIQTGCEGLNLQENFSEIYFVSPHWNPYVEEQAIARCHRLGQKEEVNIFKFEMSGFEGDSLSLEKYINNVQDVKREISKRFLIVE